MVIVFGSMDTPNSLTFTVGQITWTTSSDNFITMATAGHSRGFTSPTMMGAWLLCCLLPVRPLTGVDEI